MSYVVQPVCCLVDDSIHAAVDAAKLEYTPSTCAAAIIPPHTTHPTIAQSLREELSRQEQATQQAPNTQPGRRVVKPLTAETAAPVTPPSPPPSVEQDTA